ncbi:hypothetical protein LTSEMIN_3970, partial [Salmonella enterica subsp. enterica serovar Minnesota str. A4-603]
MNSAPTARASSSIASSTPNSFKPFSLPQMLWKISPPGAATNRFNLG